MKPEIFRFRREIEDPEEVESLCDEQLSLEERMLRAFVNYASIAIPASVLLFTLARFAFHPNAKKEILKRDKLTCQSPYCVGYAFDPERAPRAFGLRSRNGGWMVTAAHYPKKHRGWKDNCKYRGRCLCVCCHVIEEVERGNPLSEELFDSLTQRTVRYISEYGVDTPKISYPLLYEIAINRQINPDYYDPNFLRDTYSEVIGIDLSQQDINFPPSDIASL